MAVCAVSVIDITGDKAFIMGTCMVDPDWADHAGEFKIKTTERFSTIEKPLPLGLSMAANPVMTFRLSMFVNADTGKAGWVITYQGHGPHPSNLPEWKPSERRSLKTR